MSALSFADHKWRLRNDNDYRRSKGLSPLPPAPTLHEVASATAHIGAATDRADVDTDAPGVDPALFRKLRDLDSERRDAKRRVKELDAEIDAMQAQLIEQYVQAGTTQAEFDGYAGSLQSQVWARKRDESVTGPDVAAALRAPRRDHLVTPEGYNSQVLSAYLRDLEAEGKPIPAHLAEHIEATERFHIGFTKRRATRARRRIDGADSSVLGEGSGAS